MASCPVSNSYEVPLKGFLGKGTRALQFFRERQESTSTLRTRTPDTPNAMLIEFEKS